jgi:hypothetical protein
MGAYLLGLVTLPALWCAWVAAAMVAEVLGRGRRITCRWCGHVTNGLALRNRIHARIRHGLALTVAGRRRKQQWHGLTWHYAQRHGVAREEYDAALARFRQKQGAA